MKAGQNRFTESRNARTQASCRERLEALERENRELRQANGILTAALEDLNRTTQTAPASLTTQTRARPAQTAQWKEAVEEEAPWETVLVPRGTSR